MTPADRAYAQATAGPRPQPPSSPARPSQDPAVLDAINYADRYDPPVAALLRREIAQDRA